MQSITASSTTFKHLIFFSLAGNRTDIFFIGCFFFLVLGWGRRGLLTES